MLSATLKRALLDTRHPLPPTFLLPWAASLSTASVSPSTTASASPPPSIHPLANEEHPSGPDHGTKPHVSLRSEQFTTSGTVRKTTDAPVTQHTLKTASQQPSRRAASTAAPLPQPDARKTASSTAISLPVREMLPLMRAQGPHYITVHIQGKPYLVTQGDTVRLPYLMQDVEPGDTLRLNRAINLGSRDYTLKAPAPAPKIKSSTASSATVLDPTTGSLASHSKVMPTQSLATSPSAVHAPHFIPHIAKGKYSYIDDRLFVCRALVMGVESEPMRTKEKTKRRQRHIRRVKSKHRYTIIKIKELRIKSLEELDAEVN